MFLPRTLNQILILFVLLFSGGLNAQISSFPYAQDFESGAGGWTVKGNDPSWELGTPASIQSIDMATSGENAWITNLDGNYNVLDQSWVESPVFDLSSLVNPMIQFNISWKILDTFWDGGIFYSSIDDGNTWQIIGSVGSGVNWYNYSNIYPGINTDAWSGMSGGWRTAVNYISNLGGENSVKLLLTWNIGKSYWQVC